MTSLLRTLSDRDVVLIALVIGLVAVLTVAYWDYTQDDVFITFTYSRNLAEGHGFVFNPGERIQGTTTPLFALLMAGVYSVTEDLLHAGNLLSGLFLLATIAFAADLLRPALSVGARAALAVTLAVSPLVYVSFGMETLFYCALLVLTCWLWAHDRRAAALLAAAALTWTRADGVVLAGTFGLLALHDAWRSVLGITASGDSSPWLARIREMMQRLPWRLGLIYLAGIAPWFVFAWAYFGTPLPQTFSAKEEFLQGTMFLRDGAVWWEAFYGNNPLTLLAIPLIVLGGYRVYTQPRLRPIALWPALYLIGYTALNITAFWYYTPLLVMLVVLAAVGGQDVIRWIPSTGARQRWGAAGMLALVAMAAVLALAKAWDFREPPPRMATYRLVGQWLAKHTAPDDTLLLKDLGVVGYYARRHTVDSFGLIVPDMHIKTDAYAAAKYKTDWVVTTQYWEMQRLVAQDWFRYHYVPVAGFSTPGDTGFSPMTVWRRRLDLQPPTTVPQGFELPLTCTVALGPADRLPDETSASLLALDGSGDSLVSVSHPFLWDQYPAAVLSENEELIEQIALPVRVPPGRYAWRLDCGQSTTGEIDVLPVDQAAGYTAVVSASWSGLARLRGFVLPEGTELFSGGSLAISLHWEALGPLSPEDSVFVHLLDPVTGQVIAQADGPPEITRPAAQPWEPTATVIEHRRILLPPDAAPGVYNLALGWYNWRTGERLALQNSANTAVELAAPITVRWPGGSGLP